MLKRTVAVVCAAAALWAAEESVAPLGTYKEAERRYWAFQPRKEVAPPAISDPWVKTPMDAFILAGLRKAGLKPAPEADRATLIRRVTYDLTGLPPTPEEIDAFVADKSPQRLGEGRRPSARVAALRRAVGPALAGRRALRRVGRVRVRHAPAGRVPLSRLRGPQLQRRTSRTTSSCASNSRATRWTRQNRAAAGGQRLQPPRAAAQERGQPGGRQLAERSAHRDDQHRGRGVPRRDGRLRALPRSQVRSVPAVRLLPPAGAFRADAAARHRAGHARRSRPRGRRRPDPMQQQMRRLQMQLRRAPEDREGEARDADSRSWTSKMPAPLPSIYSGEGRRRQKRRRIHILFHGDYLQPVAKVGRAAAGHPAAGGRRRKRRSTRRSRGSSWPNWIADPANPLTARVMVNRIWQYHFGRGHRVHAQRFRTHGRAAVQSGAARLAGQPVSSKAAGR